MEAVTREARRRHVELLILPTAEAIERLGTRILKIPMRCCM
jgi:hypothetical protein